MEYATAGNVIGSNASLQNTDNTDNRDWRDTDDDNDDTANWIDTLQLLGGMEQIRADGNFANDFAQTANPGEPGVTGSGTPDYLFEGLIDSMETKLPMQLIWILIMTESLDTEEDGGTGIDPSADADWDGIPNYRDSDLAGFVDANSDGVDDRFDSDFDGIPDFLDLGF